MATGEAKPAYEGLVVSGDERATIIGAAALRAGGTAVDAAVATSFAIGVLKPQSCGIGGYGGFLTYAPPGEPVVRLDFNTWVPRRLKNPTLRLPGYVDTASSGGGSVAPMAVVPGLLAAHKRYGRLPLADLLQPSIELARDGFTVTERLHQYLGEHWQVAPEVQPEFASVYLPNGRPPEAGDVLVQADLAVTLEAIAARGIEPLRNGPIVDAICATVAADGGFLEPEDFIDDHSLSFAAPDETTFEDAVIYGGPLQTSGAGVVFSALGHIRSDRLGANRERPYVEELARALRAAWKERTDAARAGKKSNDTTHLCTADVEGGLASLTFTHGPTFGSGLVAPGTGIVLNGGVDLFAPAAGGPRAINNMSPLIVERPGGIRHAVGGVGGPRIPAIVLSAVVDAVHYGWSMAEAIAAPHLSVRATDGRLQCEPELLARLEPGEAELMEGFGPACGITQTPAGTIPAGDDRFRDGGFARA